MKVIILAGGGGTRLWPFSRENHPKQFLPLVGGSSFLQKTVERHLELVKPEDLCIVTHASYHQTVKKQLPHLEACILLEPEKKNTAPAIAIGLHHIQPKDDEVILVTPADHMIAPTEAYIDAALEAEKLAMKGFLVTFGVRPTRAETGFGYIKTKGERVEAFVEKPNMEKAHEFLAEGNYFWNAGIFCFTYKTVAEELRTHAPQIASLLEDPTAPHVEAISFDFAVMEQSEKVAMVPLQLSWSDIGSWESLYHHLKKDESGNVVQGDVVTHQTQDSLIFAEKRMVATIGLKDMVVIETDDAVLVADKEQSQAVKEVVGQLKKLGKKEVCEHLTTHRPWGSYTVLEEGGRYKIKRICVKPKQKLSLQMHYHRSEHWVVVKGTASVTIGEEVSVVHEGQSIFVPKSSIHRVENPGKVALEIIEVQVGEYLGEDDIVRFEDIYGRLKPEMVGKKS